ncbi:MAG: hypothetical protein RM368_33005 [Nostoc sp. DedSLP03]|uniref:hypothetical protein n=1 Tax=Nostoc sp. DedSLP03 TaxID=3075400 RepID=UPI002AD4EB16|nr:hypothetical protein [Nostoc sp. DedSLP03]MDZ7969710.1 hypothetical protein [Nostoc sp. DedSLP03]
MPLKRGIKPAVEPEMVLQVIEELKGDWSYPQVAKILSELVGKPITADALSKMMRKRKLILPKMSGRKKDTKKPDLRSLPPEFNDDTLIG